MKNCKKPFESKTTIAIFALIILFGFSSKPSFSTNSFNTPFLVSGLSDSSFYRINFAEPFTELKNDTLEIVWPSYLIYGSINPTNIYDAWLPLLPPDYAELVQDKSSYTKRDPVLYSLGMISINDSVKALFFGRNEYEANAVVDICLIDIKNKCWKQHFVVAQAWGDGTACFLRRVGWIIDVDNDQKKDIVIRSYEFVAGDVGGVVKYSNRSTDSLMVYKNMGDRFQMASVQVEETTTKKDMDNLDYSKATVAKKQELFLESTKPLNFAYFQSLSANYINY